MKRARNIASLLIAATFGLSHLALGQQNPSAPPPAPPAAQPPGAADVSEQEIDTFATIYVELQEINGRFEAEMANATSTEEAQEMQEEMLMESISTIEDHGWTLDKYNSVAQSINTDPDLTEEVMALVQERS